MKHPVEYTDQNVGHGHVYIRPDGNKARCGGPGMCNECSRDLARLQSHRPPIVTYSAADQAFLNARFRRFNLMKDGRHVAEAVQFQDGVIVVRWCTPGLPKSTVVWDSLQDAIDIHVKTGGAYIEWIDIPE